MNSKEFVLWLKGFVEGVHDFNIIPKQWDYLKQKLSEVEDKVLILESSGRTITTTPGGGSIIYATPPFTITSTTTGYPSGSNWSYTNNTYNPPYTSGGEADDIKKEPHNED